MWALLWAWYPLAKFCNKWLHLRPFWFAFLCIKWLNNASQTASRFLLLNETRATEAISVQSMGQTAPAALASLPQLWTCACVCMPLCVSIWRCSFRLWLRFFHSPTNSDHCWPTIAIWVQCTESELDAGKYKTFWCFDLQLCPLPGARCRRTRKWKTFKQKFEGLWHIELSTPADH